MGILRLGLSLDQKILPTTSFSTPILLFASLVAPCDCSMLGVNPPQGLGDALGRVVVKTNGIVLVRCHSSALRRLIKKAKYAL